MVAQFMSRGRYARLPVVALIITSLHVGQGANAGVRGEFDFPLEAFAVPASADAEEHASQVVLYEVTVPVSFRTLRGDPRDVLQVEVELTVDGERLHLMDYEPRTSLASDVVGEIEEKTTTEQSRNWSGAVGASIPIPGLTAAQIGPSADIADTGRTVRTESVQRRPKMEAVVVAGTTARGRGVFFQLRPGSERTLEGAHYLTLRIAAPQDHHGGTLRVRCRALATEDWVLFERKTTVAASKGEVKLVFASHVQAGDESPQLTAIAAQHADTTAPEQAEASPASSNSRRDQSPLRHVERPCPWCDGPFEHSAFRTRHSALD